VGAAAPYTRAVLILPPGHAESIRSRRSLSVREKRLLGLVLVLIAALAIALVIALSTTGRSSAGGCIHLTIAADTGAQDVDECGATARYTCATVLEPGAFPAESAAAIAAACRKARLPVGR
jgi:hypothetical protein